MNPLPWYPVKVRGGQEEKTKQRIEAAIADHGLANLLKEIFIPSQRVYTVKNGKKTIKKKHFAYIVMQADLENKRLCELLLKVAGVYGFITPEGTGRQYTPTPLTQQEVEQMLGIQAHQDQITHELKQNFTVGEKVEIIDGILKGKTAIVQGIDNSKKKLEATIQIFGKETKTEIAYAQVKKI